MFPVDVIAAHPNAPHARDPDIVPLPVDEMLVHERPNSSIEAMIELASGMGKRPSRAKAIPYKCWQTRNVGPPATKGARS